MSSHDAGPNASLEIPHFKQRIQQRLSAPHYRISIQRAYIWPSFRGLRSEQCDGMADFVGRARQAGLPEDEDGVAPLQDDASGSRIAYLESIRGLAAMQVLLLHLLAAFAPDLVFASHAAAPVAAAVHLSPLYFLYDGYSAVYIFFVLSGYVLTRSFGRDCSRPLAQVLARIVRLGLPAMAAVLVAGLVMLLFGRPNVAAGELSGSLWFAQQWNTKISLASMAKDGTLNALFLGYSGLPGIAFLRPWQVAAEQSFVTPLWTLSIEFYGSLIVLALCWCRRRWGGLTWLLVGLGAMFTARSAYICFFVGYLLARFGWAERRAPASALLPAFAVAAGIFVCVSAEVWQPEWLKAICASPTYLLFPGQFAPMQQKVFGAILVLIGIMHLGGLRSLLSRPWFVARSRLSFPLYLVHWPLLCGPVAALFLQLAEVIGVGPARFCAIAGATGLVFAASALFLPVDRLALDLSRSLRRRVSLVPGTQRISAAALIAAE